MSRGRLYTVLLGLLVAALLFQIMLVHPSKPGESGGEAGTPASERQPAPELDLPLGAGKSAVSLASMKGKVVLLDFWATWCGPCKESIPDLEKLYTKYHDQGLEVVGISVDTDPSGIPEVQKQLGMTYPVVLASDIPGIRDKFQFDGIPQLYVVDKKGQIAASYSGYTPDRNMDDEISKFLKE